MSGDSLQVSTYEVLRKRLQDGAAQLRERFQRLNELRAEVFGNVETRLLSTLHVTTEHNCIPRDLVSVGQHVLLGYNVQFGLKSEVQPSDVLGLYRIDGEQAVSVPLTAWTNDRFDRDFADLYRYYKNTFFSCFAIQGPHIYMVFQVGKTHRDVKAFKWTSDGTNIQYVDNRSEQEIRYPAQHDFRWTRATRDQHRSGVHPHISIGDIVFVECIGGDLTIKIEDNTASGSGIYSEPVENKDQTLDDAEIHYCLLGNLVLLKIKPYLEKDFRYLVYCVKRRQALRLDAMRQSCVQLPDDHGIIFPGGMYLQTGQHKLFDHGLTDVFYQKTVSAPNGEDFLYQFYEPVSGAYLHLRYNLIRQEVDTPLVCHGQTFFEDGRMITMRVHEAAQKHHALQLWQTPFMGPNYRVEVTTDSMLYKIGNHDLVRCMAECQEVLQLIDKDESYADLYVDLVKRTTDILDAYFWLDREETQQLSQPLTLIRDAASAAVDEYDKVLRVRNETAAELARTQSAVEELLKSIDRSRFESLDAFIQTLRDVRSWRGHTVGLRELRTIDLAAVDKLDEQLQAAAQRVGQRCVQFLVQPNSLDVYRQNIEASNGKIAAVRTVAEGRQLEKQFQEIADALELLIETLSGLQIDDLTQRTAIVDRTGDQLAELNRGRSALKSHLRSLLSGELEAEYASQAKLLDQAAAGALDGADTPERVDDALTRMMLQIEELESRFAEHESLLERLHSKRESVLAAFESRRIQLVEARSRRAEGMVSAANRILQGIASRTQRIEDGDALRAFFVSDAMVEKVRKLADSLREIGDAVRAEDVLGKLKSLADDALRQQRDRHELFVDGENLIRLGQQIFAVNRQPLELTTIVRDGVIMLHLTGTQFFQPLLEKSADGTLAIPVELAQASDLWTQTLPSESNDVYRAETLAYELFQAFQSQGQVAGWDSTQFQQASIDQQTTWIRAWMQDQPEAGYTRGVHDHDGALILAAITELHHSLGLLRYSSKVRSRVWFAWLHYISAEERASVQAWIDSFLTMQGSVAGQRSPLSRIELRKQTRGLREHLAQQFMQHVDSKFLRSLPLSQGMDYLLDELMSQSSCTAKESSKKSQRKTGSGVSVSQTAYQWWRERADRMDKNTVARLRESLLSQLERPARLWQLGESFIDTLIVQNSASGQKSEERDPQVLADHRDELVRVAIESLTASAPAVNQNLIHATNRRELHGLHGDHSRVAAGKMLLDYHEFMRRLARFQNRTVPRFKALQAKKRQLLHAAESRLRSSEFQTKVLTSFVRNRLIDEVFLPRIGENLAKQLGVAGENKRTDRMGLLLLVSPPGYGKTTLMEYIANRLGLVMVKVNGPALGHQVRSLDPAEATNASARAEIQRINLALEMGDNVMLYLDDIQHCHPELLQKFIPLCDATRRIEGVWEGQPKIYDLRGRKVAVVMAGNPYTESGERFQIPDMLANRADIYNLGEIIGGAKEAFEQSYLENCLASNPALMPLARASREDQMAVIQAAERALDQPLDLAGNFSADQVAEMLSVMRKLVKVRDIVLRVNRQYIQSAAQADAYRTEPPFKLQGSYRNMNRMAEKVAAVMNDDELMQLVVSAYEQDAQTLTRDGESNLLKFRQLAGIMTEEQAERWQKICYAYVESVRLGGMSGDDPSLQVLKSLAAIRDGLETIRSEIARAASHAQGLSAPGMATGLEPLARRAEQLGVEIVEVLRRTGDVLVQNADRIPEQKVLVQHSVPRSMTELIRSQYQLLHDGLMHVLSESNAQSLTMQRIRTALDDMLEQYRGLQTEIEAAAPLEKADE